MLLLGSRLELLFIISDYFAWVAAVAATSAAAAFCLSIEEQQLSRYLLVEETGFSQARGGGAAAALQCWGSKAKETAARLVASSAGHRQNLTDTWFVSLLSICWSLCLSLSASLSICRSFSVSFCVFISLSVSLSVSLIHSTGLLQRLPVSLWLSPFLSLSVCCLCPCLCLLFVPVSPLCSSFLPFAAVAVADGQAGGPTSYKGSLP